MSEYQKGLVDGFKLGLEEGKKIKDHDLKERSYMDGYNDGLIEGMKKTLPPPYVPKETCPKCGITISGVMNYTCHSINCPIFYTATYSAGTNGAVGAVGSMSANYESSAPGTNGPCGPTAPIDYSMR